MQSRPSTAYPGHEHGDVRFKPVGFQEIRGGSVNWRGFFHVLVFLSLIGLQAHHMSEQGPRAGTDARWYIGYALSILHESRLPPGRVEIVPLYPLWLAMWMHVDPDYRDYLQCLHENAPYWREGKKFWPGDASNCRPLRLANVGFYVQVFLGAVGTGLVWLAGWLASGRPMVAHLGAFFAVYAGSWLILGNQYRSEELVIPLLAGINVCLAWLVLSGVRRRGWIRVRTAAVAITCGLLLGALALVRPPYEFLLAALPFAAAVWMLRDRPRRREIATVTAWILVSASLVLAPWIVRNHTAKGFVGLTEGYGSHILYERLAFNAMTWRQWMAAFPAWSGGGGLRLAREWFGPDTVAVFHPLHQEYYAWRGVEERTRMRAIVASDDQLGLVLGRMWSDLPKHLAVSLPLAWRGMMQSPQIWYGNALWLLVIFSFVQGSGRNRSVLAALAFCPFFVLAVNALVSTSLPRYSVGLLMPLSVGVALPVAWIVEGAWSRMRRRRSSVVPDGRPNHPQPSATSRRDPSRGCPDERAP